MILITIKTTVELQMSFYIYLYLNILDFPAICNVKVMKCYIVML